MKEKRAATFRSDKHLRLTLRLGEGSVEVLEMRVVDEPVVAPGRVAGPFIVSVSAGDELLWVDTMDDPFVRRGMPRPGERDHHYSRTASATVVTRVPLPRGGLPANLRVCFQQATGPLPERPAELAVLIRSPEGRRLERLAVVDLPMLKGHRDWEMIAGKVRLSDSVDRT